MRADNDHDPLDQWLNQQVQPLPPPPGTFELITRRARGRKLRRLAVTVVTAAAVAAAVTIAVPVGLKLHLTTPSSTGQVAAGPGSPTSTAKPSTNGTATPIMTPSPTPSATHPAAKPSGGPVPPNFQPSSVTFDSAQTGWVIGQAGTPGTCANADSYICTSVARTGDGGLSWRGRHAPDTSGPSGPTGVSGIRFLNGTYGWAFGPELWATDDGGNTWNKVSTGGQRVTDLEASDSQAYALFATCTTPGNASSSSFAVGCTSYTLMTATAGSSDWVKVGAATSGLTNGGGSTSAVLALTSSNGYLLAPDGTLYSGPIGGTWSQAGAAPCKPGSTPQANGLPGAAQLALVNSTKLAIACNSTSSTSVPLVYTSDDSGYHWTPLSAGSWSGIPGLHGPDLDGLGVMTSLAATPNDLTITLATSTGIYVLAGGRWKPSNATGTQAPQGGFSYVGMTTNEQGVAVPADTSLHEIWMTFDGGHTWKPTSITSGS